VFKETFCGHYGYEAQLLVSRRVDTDMFDINEINVLCIVPVIRKLIKVGVRFEKLTSYHSPWIVLSFSAADNGYVV
jgi:hypothetical protein